MLFNAYLLSLKSCEFMVSFQSQDFTVIVPSFPLLYNIGDLKHIYALFKVLYIDLILLQFISKLLPRIGKGMMAQLVNPHLVSPGNPYGCLSVCQLFSIPSHSVIVA